MSPTFPAVAEDPDLFDRTRRRARRRKARTTSLAASVVLVLAAGGAFALTRTGQQTSTLITPTDQAPAADKQLIGFVPGCDTSCSVLGQVDMGEGRTLALVGRFLPNPTEIRYSPAGLVLVRGASLLDEKDPADLARGGFVSDPLADGNGNALVAASQGQAVSFFAFRAIGDSLTEVAGTSPLIQGDESSGFVSQAGSVHVITGKHSTDPYGGAVAGYRDWSWNGSAFTSTGCFGPDEDNLLGPECGAVTKPGIDRPHPATSFAPQAGPADAALVALAHCTGCVVLAREDAAAGTFAALGTSSRAGKLPRVFLMERRHGGTASVSASHPVPVDAVRIDMDTNGNVVVTEDSNDSRFFLPFSILRGLRLLQGTLADPQIIGDLNSQVVDVVSYGPPLGSPAPTLPSHIADIVTVSHRAKPDGTRIYSYLEWQFNGARFESRPCLPHPMAKGSSEPSCDLTRYPS